ncbi:MAG: 30S ribosomal protein S6 [Erysipelotrichaceae bacterium]|nr:30S ribosomal protein S6 [Erysipelotrichaceae bacterium]
MKSYEVMYIIKPSIDDATKAALIEELHGIITSHEGSIDKVNEWGLKDLAYEIDDFKKGYYVVTEFTVGVEGLNEFDRLTRINNNVIRHMIINKDEMK